MQRVKGRVKGQLCQERPEKVCHSCLCFLQPQSPWLSRAVGFPINSPTFQFSSLELNFLILRKNKKQTKYGPCLIRTH